LYFSAKEITAVLVRGLEL